MTNLSPLETWLILQAALEALLIVLMVIFLVKLRRLGRNKASVPDDVADAVQRFVSESEKMAQTFSQTLNQKKELSVNLLLKLERRINDLRELLDQTEKGLAAARSSGGPSFSEGDRANPAAPENRELVLRLAGQGLSVGEIARKSKLHRGEVELIIDLEKTLGC